MLAAIIAWLLIAVLICVAGTRMLCILYVMCSASVYIVYKLLATSTTRMRITGGSKEPGKTYMAVLVDKLTKRIQECMYKRLLYNIITTGVLPQAKLVKILKPRAVIRDFMATTYTQYLSFNDTEIRRVVPQIGRQLAACQHVDTATICRWIAAYINTELPVVRQIKAKHTHSRYEVFGRLPILLENLNINGDTTRHPIFGYSLHDTSPPADLFDNHIWDTYLNVKYPKHILSAHGLAHQSIFTHKGDGGVFPVRHYSYVSKRINNTVLDIYTRNLLPAPVAIGEIDSPADVQFVDDIRSLYIYTPLRVVPDNRYAWPRVGMRATITHRHYRQIFTQQLRAHTWADYFEYVLQTYLPKKSKPGRPLGVADYIVDLATGGKREMVAIRAYIDKILADVYTSAPVYNVESIATQINTIDAWLKSCGDDLDTIVAHDANNVLPPDHAKIIGYSNTPNNFHSAILPAISARAEAIVARYQSIPTTMLKVVTEDYPRLLELHDEFVARLLRRHTGVRCVFTPYTLKDNSIVIHTLETYEWVLGDTRYECVYSELPPLPKIVCAYVAGRYAYRGNLDEIYLNVAELIPASIFDTPTADNWRAVLKYCKQFSNIADGEEYVDNTADLYRDDVLGQMRADADAAKESGQKHEDADRERDDSGKQRGDSDTDTASETNSILSWLGRPDPVARARGKQSADEELSVEKVREVERSRVVLENSAILDGWQRAEKHTDAKIPKYRGIVPQKKKLAALRKIPAQRKPKKASEIAR